MIQTVLHSELPEDFQNAETLLANGLIDRIVPRRDLRDTLSFSLRWF